MSTTRGGRELTVREAARSVHRAEETIRRWIWTGKLAARKRGGVYRVQEGDLIAAAGGRIPAGSSLLEPDLREWVAEVTAWRASNGVTSRAGAGQLVVEDRVVRSGLVDR